MRGEVAGEAEKIQLRQGTILFEKAKHRPTRLSEQSVQIYRFRIGLRARDCGAGRVRHRGLTAKGESTG